MESKIVITLIALALGGPLARASQVPGNVPTAEELLDSPPLVKSEDAGSPAAPATPPPAPTPSPTSAAPAGDAPATEPTPAPAQPAGPARVGPPPATEVVPAEEPSVPGLSTPQPVDPNAPPPRPVEELKDAPPLVTPGESSWLGPRQPLFGNGDSSLLQLSTRLDIAFLAGGSIQQGFSLPSVRMTAAGSTGEIIHYRLSLGQTREFSSAQLPQVTPVEGYVEFQHGEGEGAPPTLAWRIGMFTPEFSPWWTPDLSDIALPDYHEIDRSLFLSRDLGAQLTYRPFGDHLKISAGIFNGSGIVTLNTNSSRAFTGNIEADFGSGRSTFALGASAYRSQQASAGSVNYRADTIGNLYAKADLMSGRLVLTGELVGGQLVDSTRNANPLGAAATIDVGLWSWGRWFTRAEGLQGTGTGLLHHYQLGPVLEFSGNVQTWILYDYLDSGTSNGAAQQQACLRLRLSV